MYTFLLQKAGCDFHFSTNLTRASELVEAIIQEIRWKKGPLGQPIETVYFGEEHQPVYCLNYLEEL